MTKQAFTQKSNGDTLSATEWNELTAYINTAVDEINAGGSTGGGSNSGTGDSHIVYDGSTNGKHNLTIQTTSADQYQKNGQTKGGKINIESVSDIQLKPGDDIILYSHHRDLDKQDEVAIKVTDGDDVPVKLQVNTSDIVLTTKDKSGADSDELNIAVNSGANTRGYLKVRAQAVDLRCEKHGGIALQPKGYDSDGNMNKIKFEHGGGDGLEFGTFNTEKTSLFTDEYRFNREGVWKMATRETTPSGKTIRDEGNVPVGKPNTADLKYVKQSDDFYDIINPSDEECTTKDIIKTAYALNGNKNRHTKITNKGAIEIATNPIYSIVIEETPADPSTAVSIDTIAETPAEFATVAGGDIFNEGDFTIIPTVESVVYTNGTQYFSFSEDPAPAIKIESGSELKLGGILDFGSSFNFGETDNGIEVQYKLTKKNNTKDCGILKVVGINNHETNDLTVEGVTIAPGQTEVIAQCSLLDMVKLVNYMKTNNEGPWASNL